MDLPSRLQAHIETNAHHWVEIFWHNAPLLVGLLIGIIFALTYWQSG